MRALRPVHGTRRAIFVTSAGVCCRRARDRSRLSCACASCRFFSKKEKKAVFFPRFRLINEHVRGSSDDRSCPLLSSLRGEYTPFLFMGGKTYLFIFVRVRTDRNSVRSVFFFFDFPSSPVTFSFRRCCTQQKKLWRARFFRRSNYYYVKEKQKN